MRKVVTNLLTITGILLLLMGLIAYQFQLNFNTLVDPTIVSVSRETISWYNDTCIPNFAPQFSHMQEIKFISMNPLRHNCSMQLSDDDIVERCRLQYLYDRHAHPLMLMWPEFTNVPPSPQGAEAQKLQKKYQDRVEAGSCLLPRGMWGNPFNSRCTIVQMAEIGKYKPNDLILDWGTGCGHQATLMARLYGARVIGLDLNKAVVKWATKHSIGKFYATDAINLSWIPNNTFDHFYSYAAACYVPPDQLCRFGRDVVRIIKPGGTALFGWMQGLYCKPFGAQPKSVWDCMKDLPGVTVTIYDDKDLWKSPDDLISTSGTYSVIIETSPE